MAEWPSGKGASPEGNDAVIIDCHVHLAGVNEAAGNIFKAEACPVIIRNALARRFGISPADMLAPGADDRLAATLCRWLNESQLDAAVLLAMDGVYDLDGKPVPERTWLRVDNDFVARVAASTPKACWGASIHPYRRDAIAELERVVQRGACLIKWLPSVQQIDPEHPRCYPFYEAMAHFKIPLLCHTGNEHLIKGANQSLNRPQRLVPALERQVTVIAAHCGTRLFLHERCWFGDWQRLALEHEHFYGDLSAFVYPTRVRPLRTLLRTPALLQKIVFGSDVPVTAFPSSYLFQIGLRRVLALRRMENPFDQVIETFRAVGVPDECFSRVATLLRQPQGEGSCMRGSMK